MFDIITFGSATKDIFLKTNKFKTIENKEFLTGKGVCLNLGSKVEIDEIKFSSGGGGTNTAVTFANQGFKVAYCGAIGNDLAGKEIIEELGGLGVDTKFIIVSKEKPTNHSIIFSGNGNERTILVYRGASEYLTKKNIPWKKIKSKWFYIAPLSGGLCDVFGDIIDFANKNKIKIALNPGFCHLSLPFGVLVKNLSKVDILILNQEEASFLTKIPYENEKEIFKKIDEVCHGVTIMTKGGNGVIVSDGQYLYRAKPRPHRKIEDTTGAGDSFASGFVSAYIRYNGDIEKSIQLGMGNSTACLARVGAKAGLLKKDEKFVKVKITKEECLKNGLCQCK